MYENGGNGLRGKLNEVLVDALQKNQFNGASLLVMKEGHELCYLEAGFADEAAGKKIQRDTIFRLYSMTKPVTALATMILVERGKLSLQAPIAQYLPAFQGVGGAHPITVHHLLNMTSGMTYGNDESDTDLQTKTLLTQAEESLCTQTPMTTQQFAEKAAKIPLLFEPGTAWKYGISADIMGAVIEKVSGKTLGAFLQDEIFQPLGMADTAFYVPAHKQGRLAKPYEADANGKLQEYTANNLGIRNQLNTAARFESGGAGLVSTIDDYEKLARMLLQNGSCGANRILQPHTVAYLTQGCLPTELQPHFVQAVGQNGFSYGNYLRVLWNPHQAATLGRPMEYCWDGWMGCCFVNCPQEKLTFLIMQQTINAGDLVAKLRNVLFAHDL